MALWVGARVGIAPSSVAAARPRHQPLLLVASAYVAVATAIAGGGVDLGLPSEPAPALPTLAARPLDRIPVETASAPDLPSAAGESVVAALVHPVDANTPVGALTIPKLSIWKAPIFDRGLDARGEMQIAPGFALTHYGRSQPLGGGGNAVLYGHDDIEGSIFRYLHELQPGDLFSLETWGRVWTYRVTGQTIVTPDRVDILSNSPTARLTLFTCYPYRVDSHRVVVFAAPA